MGGKSLVAVAIDCRIRHFFTVCGPVRAFRPIDRDRSKWYDRRFPAQLPNGQGWVVFSRHEVVATQQRSHTEAFAQ